MPPKARTDPVAGRRLTRAALFFAVAMLMVLASNLWTIVSAGGQGGDASGPQSLAVCCSLLMVFAASGYVVYSFAKLWVYRCPKCGVRAARLPEAEAGSAIRYRCPKCRTVWDTGWHEGGD